MRYRETLERIMARRGEPIDLTEHTCEHSWCSGTCWRHSHHSSQDTFVTGRDGDVADGTAVGIHVVYDETEDTRPRLLLHIGSNTGADEDCSSTPAQARRIALHLLEAADALDDWREEPRLA